MSQFPADADFWEVTWKFEGKDFDTLRSLVDDLKFDAQVDIFKQGEEADGMYLVLEGFALVIRTEEDGSEHTIGIVSQGQSFGELGLLNNRPRTGTVAAGTELHVLRITPEQLETLEKDHPKVAASLYKQLARSMADQLVSRQFEE